MIDAPSTKRSRGSDAIDDVLGAMANEQRRRVLYHLRETDGDARVDDLVRHLSERTGADQEVVAIRLRHAVLPLLDDRDVVDYDRTNGRIRYEGGPLATELLDWAGERERTD